jgi:hypothetical protein
MRVTSLLRANIQPPARRAVSARPRTKEIFAGRLAQRHFLSPGERGRHRCGSLFKRHRGPAVDRNRAGRAALLVWRGRLYIPCADARIEARPLKTLRVWRALRQKRTARWRAGLFRCIKSGARSAISTFTFDVLWRKTLFIQS